MTASLLPIILNNAAVSASCFLGLWLVSLWLKDVSFVDSWWAYGIVLLALATRFQTNSPDPHALLLLGICAVWGIRLGTYLIWRWRQNGADPRYEAIMRSSKSRRGWSFAKTAGLQVFLLQGVLQFVVALPVQLGQMNPVPIRLGPSAIVGVTLAAIGLFFESVGDWQLVRFKRDPENKGKVLDVGLWRYTRHPNYFGDACVGWGLYLIAVETPLGPWSIIGPLVLTILLTRVSGIPLLENHLNKKRPGYDDYVARTSSFIPWYPTRDKRPVR